MCVFKELQRFRGPSVKNVNQNKTVAVSNVCGDSIAVDRLPRVDRLDTESTVHFPEGVP